MPPFDPSISTFSPTNAWWLSELCRIAYTPDGKEAGRFWHRDKPSRHDYLDRHTPFREVLNLHKTGNHVSLYRLADREGAVLCFRGTSKLRQWLMNLTALPATWTRASETDRGICVHQGFQILFNRVWPLIEPSLVDLGGPLILTGHSLGGAFATLAAVAFSGSVTSLVTFGSPRVGNEAFVQQLAGLPIQRIVNHHDIVPLLPQRDEKLGERDFRHAGDLYYLGQEIRVLHAQSGPEISGDPAWEPVDPLDFLRQSLGRPEPPECLLDHAPTAYSEKLRALAKAVNLT
ncbi:MAG: lipase family protein [Verrucomicrobiae bacterium]|nr:lipase family protein [Verrucomicrobiae bacterium]